MSIYSETPTLICDGVHDNILQEPLLPTHLHLVVNCQISSGPHGPIFLLYFLIFIMFKGVFHQNDTYGTPHCNECPTANCRVDACVISEIAYFLFNKP